MKSLLRKYALFFILFLIGILLLGNIYLIDRNNTIIRQNKDLQEEAAEIKVATGEIIKNVHFVDMTLRGFGLRQVDHYRRDLLGIGPRINATYGNLERLLRNQAYPMEQFYALKDSIENYFRVVEEMRVLIEHGHHDEFLKILSEDRGYRAWKAYDQFSKQVIAFENQIVKQAEDRYNATLRNSYLLQVLLFFIIIPTLGYTAFFTRQSMKLSEQLRKSEIGRNEILENQKQRLEERVQERTREIQSKNEEIVTHNRLLTVQQEKIAVQHAKAVKQNEQLQEATKIIEDQSQLIRDKNNELIMEVARQTQDIHETNLELVEHNNRLEQFAFIISHNLRAPIARLVGLSNVLKFTDDEAGQRNIVELIVKSTHELDSVIADLNQILRIQKLSAGVFEEIALEGLMQKMRSILDNELTETHSLLLTDFSGVKSITSLPQYVESIFYNLISNAIKYRHPERTPVIRINARRVGTKLQIDVIDNGIGIDVEKNRANLFSLYKRFHFHVEGKGLGLYLVKTQVTALGGTIDVASKPDGGTVFTILLDN